jgi:hypothetical protein
MVAYCRRASEGIDLCVGEPTGGQSHRIASFTGGVVVAFRPSSPHVTVASASDPSSGMFDALELIPATGGPRRRVWQGPFVSFGWDPTGGQLVLVVPTQTGDGRYALYALDAGGGLLAATDGFLPSDESRAAFAFFDQYLQSHCAWSPDGSVIGIAGRLASDSVSSSLGDIAGPFALLWEPRPGVPLKLVGPATFVSFAPAAVNNR